MTDSCRLINIINRQIQTCLTWSQWKQSLSTNTGCISRYYLLQKLETYDWSQHITRSSFISVVTNSRSQQYPVNWLQFPQFNTKSLLRSAQVWVMCCLRVELMAQLGIAPLHCSCHNIRNVLNNCRCSDMFTRIAATTALPQFLWTLYLRLMRTRFQVNCSLWTPSPAQLFISSWQDCVC